MNATFRRSFARDLRRIRDARVREQVRDAIENVESASEPREIRNLKKLAGGGPFYRVRIGEYRIGLRIEADTATFIRVLDRKEIYRYFP